MTSRCRQWTRLIALIAAASMLHACAFANGRYQSITIQTNVPAKIHIDGAYVGSTTQSEAIVTDFKRGGSNYVLATAEGYESQTAPLNNGISTLGAVDVIVGCLLLVPLITLLTGHAFRMDPERVLFDLERES